MKNRYDIYLSGTRVPVRLNGYVAGLVAASSEGVTHAATNALVAFLYCEEVDILPRLDAWCASNDTSRSWLIEHLLAVRLGRLL
jgi:hypothetical protein